LNADGALSPRAQRGRSQSWAPTSVRAILKRTLYRGEIVWAQTAKRDKWGRKHQRRRPESDWIRRPATAPQIVSDQEWAAAHARIDAARALYLRGTHGRAFGRPADGTPAKYLLTGLSQCGECGNGLIVKSRSHGQRRAYFYGCGGYHNRGQAICSNYTEIPMADGNDIVLEALLDEVLDKTMLTEAIDETVTILRGTDRADRVTAIETELAKVNEERARLAGAIAAGGQLDGLLSALQARETRRATLEAQREQLRAERRLHASEAARVRDELFELAQSWRRVLADDPTHARPIVSSLLKGRVTFTPTAKVGWWEARGHASLEGLFTRVFASGMASPTGFEPVF
jgi:site-specific DNA recombinase